MKDQLGIIKQIQNLEIILNKLNTIQDIIYPIKNYKISYGRKEKIKNLLIDSYDLYCKTQSNGFDNFGNNLYEQRDKVDDYVKNNAISLLYSEITIVIKTLETMIDDLKTENGWSHYTSTLVKTKTERVIKEPPPINKLEYFDEKKFKYAQNVNFIKAENVERKFFNINRNKKLIETPNLSDDFLNSRKFSAPLPDEDLNIDSGSETSSGDETSDDELSDNELIKAEPINLNDVSNRTAIAADTGAIAKSIAPFTLTEISTATEIVDNLKWHNKGGKAWNHEKILRGEINILNGETESFHISMQYAPFAGNMGNFVMRGIGDYGANGELNILHIINETTRGEANLEKKLAKLLISSSKKGQGITEKILYNAGMYLYTDEKDKIIQIKQINRICYLCLSKEISRRKNQGFKNDRKGNMTEVPEFPFGIAIAMALKLIANGHLKMKDVFDSDSTYGVATGKEILHERNIEKTIKKFQRVFNLYQQYYGKEQPSNTKKSSKNKEELPKLFPSSEDLHKILLEVYGGESDTSGNEYSSDEETFSEKRGKLKKIPTYDALYKKYSPS